MLLNFMHPRRKLKHPAEINWGGFAKLTVLSSEHTDFSESTEEIAPMTEEEKKNRLEELRERLKSKRAASALQDKEEAKRNEVRAVTVWPQGPLLTMLDRKSDKSQPRSHRSLRKTFSARSKLRRLPANDRRSSMTSMPRNVSRQRLRPTRPSDDAKRRRLKPHVREEPPRVKLRRPLRRQAHQHRPNPRRTITRHG